MSEQGFGGGGGYSEAPAGLTAMGRQQQVSESPASVPPPSHQASAVEVEVRRVVELLRSVQQPLRNLRTHRKPARNPLNSAFPPRHEPKQLTALLLPNVNWQPYAHSARIPFFENEFCNDMRVGEPTWGKRVSLVGDLTASVPQQWCQTRA
jgi:hypothetical protein